MQRSRTGGIDPRKFLILLVSSQTPLRRFRQVPVGIKGRFRDDPALDAFFETIAPKDCRCG
jgi:hypothetical protein